MSSTQFLNHREEQYYKDASLIEADKYEEEQQLWQWVNENPIVQKDVPVMGKSLYLYNSENDLNLNLQF